MSVSILECLMNAKINLVNNRGNSMAVMIGQDQLVNAVTLLEKGYDLHDGVDPLLEEFGDLSNVPEKQQA